VVKLPPKPPTTVVFPLPIDLLSGITDTLAAKKKAEGAA
jgi:hypothetical protein